VEIGPQIARPDGTSNFTKYEDKKKVSKLQTEGFRDRAISLYTVQTSNTPCPHTSCKVY
jgi:hypothetical protein